MSHPESINTLTESEENQWMELATSEDSQTERHGTAENISGIQSSDLSKGKQAAEQRSDGQSTRSDMQHLLSRLRASPAGSTDDLRSATMDLSTVLPAHSNNIRIAFTRKLLLLLTESDSPIILENCLNAVIALGPRALEHDCINAGMILGFLKLLKSPVVAVRMGITRILSSIFGGSLKIHKEVVESDAFDSLSSMVESVSQVEATAAIIMLHSISASGGSDIGVMMTQRFAKKVTDRATARDSSTALIGQSCRFLASCLMYPGSYSLGVSQECVEAAKTVYWRNKDSNPPDRTIALFSVMALKNAATNYPDPTDNSINRQFFHGSLIPIFLDGVQIGFEECCNLAVMGLRDISKSRHYAQDFETMGVYDVLAKIVRSTNSIATFQTCIAFVEKLVPPSESLVLTSGINAFVDVIMHRITQILSDHEFLEMVAGTLLGLHVLLDRSFFRDKLLNAGGPAIFLRLLNDVMFLQTSPERLPLLVLKLVCKFLLSGDACAALHKGGATAVLLDIIPRHRNHLAWIILCLCNLLSHSEDARTFVDFRADFIPLIRSGLISSDRESVVNAIQLFVVSTRNPNLHIKIIKRGLCKVLIHLATSTHDKTILHTAFWGLDNLLTAANAHQHETIDHVMHEQILQKIHSHVMPMQGLGPIALKGPMRVTFTILSSKHVMIETVAPVLAASIMDALDRLDDHPCDLWYIALHCLALFAKTLGGREAIFEAGPTLRIFKRPFENPALSSDLRVPAVASAVLRLLDEDPRFAPIVVEQGLISCLLNLLLVPEGLWRHNVTLIIISILNHSDISFQKAIDAGLCTTLIQLLSSSDSLLLHRAFGIFLRCSMKRRRRQLMLECSLPDNILSLLRSCASSEVNALCFGFVSEFCRKDVQFRDELFQMGLLSCIRLQLSSEVDRLKEFEEAAQSAPLVASVSPGVINELQAEMSPTTIDRQNLNTEAVDSASIHAFSVLSLWLPEQMALDPATGDIFFIFSSLLRHRDRDLSRAVLRETYRIAMQGPVELQRAIAQHELEDLVRLHACNEYSRRAEAAGAIKELTSDPELLHYVIQRLADFLDYAKLRSDEVLLSTTLIVLDDFARASDEAEAAANLSAMMKVSMAPKVEVLMNHPHSLVSSKAQGISILLKKVAH